MKYYTSWDPSFFSSKNLKREIRKGCKKGPFNHFHLLIYRIITEAADGLWMCPVINTVLAVIISVPELQFQSYWPEQHLQVLPVNISDRSDHDPPQQVVLTADHSYCQPAGDKPQVRVQEIRDPQRYRWGVATWGSSWVKRERKSCWMESERHERHVFMLFLTDSLHV